MKSTKSASKNGAGAKQNHERLKCNLPFDEALHRAMLVKPPKDWKYGRREKAAR